MSNLTSRTAAASAHAVATINHAAAGGTGPRRTVFPAVGKLVSADLLIGPLDRNSDVPLHTQVYAGLRDSILDGRLRPGASIPSTRALPSLLGVSRNTVLEAYNQLMAEGFIEPRVGSGTYVALSIPDHHLRPRKAEGSAPTGGNAAACGPTPAIGSRAAHGRGARVREGVLAAPGSFLPGVARLRTAAA